MVAEGGTQRRALNKPRASNSSTAYVQIFGTGMDTHDTLPSVLLFFDKFRIIFNAGEGLQRFCAEHKIKLSKVDYVCLTRVCSETVGGLPGLLLTLAGLGKGHAVKLWGPLDLKLLVSAMKSFVPHDAIHHDNSKTDLNSQDQFSTASCLSEGPVHVCENGDVKISAILLQPNPIEVSTVKPCDMSVVYICELAEIKGKFYRDRAIARGVNPGPKYKKLQDQESVKSDRYDFMVHPGDVMDPPTPGPIVLIVDCPTESHAEKLFISQSLCNYHSSKNRIVNCIVHLSPASVVSTANYQEWMGKFGSAQHIMAGHSMKNLGKPILQSSARLTHRLQYLCPQFFPNPALWSHQHHNDAEVGFLSLSKEPYERLCDSVSAENLLKFTLLPYAQLGLDKSMVPSFMAPSQVIDDLLLEIPEITKATREISQLWCHSEENEGGIAEESGGSLPSCLKNIQRDDAEIVLLGTGSSQPSKYRNVSSIFVNLFSKGSLLLDCGEGTLAQLKRRYGIEGAASAIRNLRCIWISHIHADHHAGLVRLLAQRRDLLKGKPHEPLHVVGPRQLESYLIKYKELEDLDMQFLDCRVTTAESWEDCLKTELGDNINIEETDSNLFDEERQLRSCSNRPKVSALVDDRETDSELFVEEREFQSCSKRQKLSASVDDNSDFATLRSLKEVLNEAGLERLTSFPVVHCPEAFGVILKASKRTNGTGTSIEGWKVVYSGDTRPCKEVIQASEDATLLIHEATFEDCLAEDAVAKNHSTTEEAMNVGNSAKVFRIILTHFSQRYPKIPSIDEWNSQKACVAFDLMSINLADLPILPRILPGLKLLFRNDVTEDLEVGSDLQ